MKDLKTIAGQFEVGGTVREILPYGSGHINDTFKFETDGGQFLLQRINHAVFKNVEGLTANLVAVTSFLREKVKNGPGPMQVLKSIPTPSGEYFIRHQDGNYWRVLEFIRNSHSYDRVPGDAIAREGGRAYGWFFRMLSDFPADKLVDTIPNFHNADFRIGNFKAAVRNDRAGRVAEVAKLIDQLMEREDDMRMIYALGREGKIPVRVTHNDTKINNVLFNGEDRGFCVIDLDTVMPGYVHFDFGDAIRTFTNDADEDEKDPVKVVFNLDSFRGFTKGFLSETKHILHETELQTLYLGPLYITYEQTIRFLTDYLEGDTYYKVHYPGHNLVRSFTQFSLLEKMEARKTEMQDIIMKA